MPHPLDSIPQRAVDPGRFPLILVVDDDEPMRILLRDVLENIGYQVIEVGNGQDGLEVCKRVYPDLIVLDCMMPVMDGLTFCQELRTTLGAASVPVLMITGLTDLEIIDRAFAVGITDYIVKPVSISIIRQKVHQLLQSHNAQTEPS
ncbi:MAG: response regulator [Leptolyngbyaceae cyanobacterium CRU_2_3]|nr:response regulator [Leptolyngbyaceae cyanobacterium CRU_2_3]